MKDYPGFLGTRAICNLLLLGAEIAAHDTLGQGLAGYHVGISVAPGATEEKGVLDT